MRFCTTDPGFDIAGAGSFALLKLGRVAPKGGQAGFLATFIPPGWGSKGFLGNSGRVHLHYLRVGWLRSHVPTAGM